MTRNSGVLMALALLAAPPARVHAYEIGLHEELVLTAFDRERAAAVYADRYSAHDIQVFLDTLENGNSDQPKHSMRPSGSSLKDAQAEAVKLRGQYMDLAVKAALAGQKGLPGQKAVAGLYLGRILHMVQDEKHNWCSCGPKSNLNESSDPCSSAAAGCASEGWGHHNLFDNCFLRHVSDCGGNFQCITDKDPTKDPVPTHWDDAIERSRRVLREFAARVNATKVKAVKP